MLRKPTNHLDIKRTEQLFYSLIDSPHLGVYAVCEERFLFVNQKIADMLGYQRHEMLERLSALDIFAPEEHHLVIESRQRRLRGDVSETYSQRRGRKQDGSLVDLEVFGSVTQIDGRLVTLAIVLDITRRKKTEASARLAEVVYKTTSEAMVITDPQGGIMHINPAFTQITGYTHSEVIGKNICTLSPNMPAQAYKHLWSALESTGTWQGEIWSQRKDGEQFVENLRINTSFDENGVAQYRVGLFSDITKRKQTENLIWRQANYDFLTGLPNRKMLIKSLEDALIQYKGPHHTIALLFLDLDHFKDINDQFGHPTGDQLLQQVARRLNHTMRRGDIVGRMGGDEFMVIMQQVADAQTVESICKRLLAIFERPFRIEGESVNITASVGVTLFSGDASDVTELFKRADLAMYAAKNKGRNQFCWFDSQLQERAIARRRLGRELLDGLARREFMLEYQPIIDLNTGTIRKAEALIRWNHPDRGRLGPIDFIPFAEDSGVIGPIGDWVFHEATRQAKKWRRDYCSDFQISINVSPAQFTSRQAEISQWPGLLQQNKTSGMYSVVIEITEGLLMDSTGSIQQQLRSFRNGGMQIALDDFGTGYSSLAYLKKFDIDYIKIDRSFISNLGPNTDDRALCDAIIVMAHRLGLKVVAEGIETAEQHQLLQEGQCDYGQGYFFGRPMAADAFTRLLEDGLQPSRLLS